ncbi:MAG: hypothetical protein WBG46_01065 [Nonlabens sp.]
MIFKKIILLLGILLLSNCSVFQSKYVEVEEIDGNTYDVYNVELLENKILGKNDDELNQLIFNLEHDEDTDFEIGMTIELKSDSRDYKVRYIYEAGQQSISVENNQYDIYLTNPNNLSNLNRKIGTIRLLKGEKRAIKIRYLKYTVTETIVTSRKVLRSELPKNKI